MEINVECGLSCVAGAAWQASFSFNREIGELTLSVNLMVLQNVVVRSKDKNIFALGGTESQDPRILNTNALPSELQGKMVAGLG